MTDFDNIFDAAVREHANPEPRSGYEQRIMARLHGAEERLPKTSPTVWTRIRDSVSPRPLDPQSGLFLQSRGSSRNSPSFLTAIVAHAVAMVLIGYLVQRHTVLVRTALPVAMVTLDAPSPKVLPRAVTAGGGGGQRGPTPVTRGTPPKFAERQIVPPKAPPLVEAKIYLEPTIEVQRDLKMASSLPQIGVASSPLIGMSMGDGHGTGIGSGNGSGLGPGSGANVGGGARRVGGGVSAPVLIHSVEPEFSDEARKAKLMGNVLVNLWVDQNGNPTHVHVLRGVGMGLDEKAVAAVRQYRFQPARENGKPVMVEMNVEVLFQIF